MVPAAEFPEIIELCSHGTIKRPRKQTKKPFDMVLTGQSDSMTKTLHIQPAFIDPAYAICP